MLERFNHNDEKKETAPANEANNEKKEANDGSSSFGDEPTDVHGTELLERRLRRRKIVA